MDLAGEEKRRRVLFHQLDPDRRTDWDLLESRFYRSDRLVDQFLPEDVCWVDDAVEEELEANREEARLEHPCWSKAVVMNSVGWAHCPSSVAAKCCG